MNLGAGNEGIQVVKQNGKYFIFIVGGNPINGTTPKLIRFEFGTNITNTTPIATDFGNLGNMLEPIDLYIFQDNGHYYGFTANAENNTLTRFDFTTDLSNTPTAINIGNIGGLLNYPTGINAINDNGFWRVFLANGGSSTLLRLDFGNSLLNTPTAINLGNPNNSIDQPRDLIMESYCEGIVGFVVNGTSNTISRLNLSSFTSIPTAVNLGNIGNFNFPHSLAKLFRSGTDVYSFVTNVNNNTITRIKFQGCTNSSIPSSTSQTPPTVSYNVPGIYNINLTIDDGLSTQSVFCKKVVVVLPKKDSVNYTICTGQSYLGHSAAGIYRDTFKTSNCDSIRILNLKVLPASVTTLDTIPASCGSVTYNSTVYLINTLVTNTIKNYLGCDSIIQNHQIIVNQNKRDTTKVSICNGQSYLGYNVSGVYKLDSVRLSSGCDSIAMVKLSVDKYIKDSINISICYGDKYATYQYAGIYYDTVKSTTFCDTIRAINLSIKTKLNPKLLDDASICHKDSIVLNPGNFYSYLWNTNATAKTITIKSVGTYWVQVADTFGCKARDTFNLIAINPIPKDFLPNSLSVCDGEQYTLTGYYSYNWMTGETTPTISLSTLPLYSVKVTDANGCSGSDSMKVNYVGSLNIQPTNAFSPNDDGVNETFKPFSGSCIVSYSMKIFDRWGQLLFETTNPNTGWNGKYKGTTLPTAVYYYIINYKNLLGIDNRKAGSITLLR
jgi:gliding motility-associated-like protein